MPRHHVLVTERGPTVFKNVRKTEAGMPLVMMTEAASLKLVMDFSAYLGSDTITGATSTAENVTCTLTTSSPTVTLALSGASGRGDVALSVTLSSGEIWSGLVHTDLIDDQARPSRYV